MVDRQQNLSRQTSQEWAYLKHCEGLKPYKLVQEFHQNGMYLTAICFSKISAEIDHI